MRKLLHDIFPVKPVIGMVHIQYSTGASQQEVVDCSMRDVENLERGRVDGLMFENWGGDYSSPFMRDGELKYINAVLEVAKRYTKLPMGVNILPMDYVADLDLAFWHRLKFVQLDTFVDNVRTDYENEFIIRPKPGCLRQYLRPYFLMTNIQTKHYQTRPSNKKLETSAKQAVEAGADTIVVSGRLTGKRTPRSKILRVRNAVGDFPIFIGSGLDENNVLKLLLLADGAIVGSSLKKDGITENPVDIGRVKRFMDAVYKLR